MNKLIMNIKSPIWFILLFSCAVSAFDYGDEFIETCRRESYFAKNIDKKIDKIKALKNSGKKLFLIIGRGNVEQGHEPLPKQESSEVVWIFADKSSSGMNPHEDSALWIDFDNVEQVKRLPDNLFDFIGFDWSVLKFFNNLDDIMPELARLLSDEGTIYMPAGEQTGMMMVQDCPIFISESKYPIRAQQCMSAKQKVFDQITKIQRNYLRELFKGRIVEDRFTDTYPLAPEKKNNLSNYFCVMNKNKQDALKR